MTVINTNGVMKQRQHIPLRSKELLGCRLIVRKSDKKGVRRIRHQTIDWLIKLRHQETCGSRRIAPRWHPVVARSLQSLPHDPIRWNMPGRFGNQLTVFECDGPGEAYPGLEYQQPAMLYTPMGRLKLRRKTCTPSGEEGEEVGDVDGAIAAGGGHVAEGGGASPVGEQCEKVGDIDAAVGGAGAVGGTLAGVDDAIFLCVNPAWGAI